MKNRWPTPKKQLTLEAFGSIFLRSLCCTSLVGHMATLEELEAQIRSLKKRAKEDAAEARNTNKRLKRAGGALCLAKVLHQAGVDGVKPALDKAVVMKLLVLEHLAEGQWDIVASYALGQGRQAKCGLHGFDIWDVEVRRNIVAGLQLLYLAVDFKVLVASLDDSANEVASLSKYVIEYRLWHWVLDLNCNKGVKPGTFQILSKACTVIPKNASSQVTADLRASFMNTDHGSRSAFRWVASFKDRWHAKLSQLPVGENLEVSSVQAKVSLARA